jgi:hypothetical protein
MRNRERSKLLGIEEICDRYGRNPTYVTETYVYCVLFRLVRTRTIRPFDKAKWRIEWPTYELPKHLQPKPEVQATYVPGDFAKIEAEVFRQLGCETGRYYADGGQALASESAGTALA